MKKTLMLCLLCIGFILTSAAQSLNSRMIAALRKSIGDDLRGYKTYSYPTDNFGVITCYEKKVNDKNFLCDTWHCIGHGTVPSDPGHWLDVYGYVVPSGGGVISLDEQTKKDYTFQVALPKIADIINIGAGFKKNTSQNIQITMGTAYKRKLLKDSLINYFNTSTATSSAKTAYLNGTLRLIVADVVITNMSATVTLTDSTTIADIEAKIGSGKSKVFSDASLTVKIDKVTKGTYKFSIDHPFIFAYLPKRQPGAGALAGSATFDKWIDDSLSYPKDPTLLKHSIVLHKSTTSR